MGLFHDAVEEIAGFDGLIDLEGDPLLASHVDITVEILCPRVVQIREDQIPVGIRFHRAHERVGDPDRKVEVGDGVFVGLAGDELFDIRMVHTQDCHVGAAAGTALGHFTESVVIDSQETDRAGGLTGGRAHNGAFRAQAGEGEAVPAAGLLDQRGIAERREDTALFSAHIIADRENKTGCELSQRSAGTGEGRGIREKLAVRQHLVVAHRCLHDITVIDRFRAGHVIGHAPERTVDRLRRGPVRIAADISLFKNLPSIIAHFNRR